RVLATHGTRRNLPVAPHRIALPTVPCGFGMLVGACIMLQGVESSAQTSAQSYADPLTPKLQTDARNPPRFRLLDRSAIAHLGAPATFVRPSGAGTTGFVSTNSRKRAMQKISAKVLTLASNVNAIAFGAPGAPPVQIGPIRKKPKAHVEPGDPYAPLG